MLLKYKEEFHIYLMGVLWFSDVSDQKAILLETVQNRTMEIVYLHLGVGSPNTS